MPEQEYAPQVEYIAKGIVINDQGKREKVLVEAHQSLEWAEKAASRMYFDEGAKFTIVFKAVEIPYKERAKLREERERENAEQEVPF